MPFGLRPWHIAAIVVVALIIFGPSRLPSLGKSMGNFFRDLRDGAKDMSSGFKEGLADAEVAVSSAKGTIVEATKANPQPQDGSANRQTIKEGNMPAGNFCISCGTANPTAANFCSACGKKLKG